ncbi:MAG: chromate efflux transporter [Bauldia sp.]|nr:chromate efflux transporter [Bauldia sp.]
MQQTSTPEAGGSGAGGSHGLLPLFAVFFRLGLTSFGGPVAHLAFFRDEFVTRRRWLGERAYADLVALCQFLPGPASSQVGMGIGLTRAGIPGAIAAWLGFTLPSAIVMVAAGYGVLAMDTGGEPGWLAGLKIVAAAVVAQAVWGMARSHAADPVRIVLAVAAGAIAIAWPAGAGQIVAILLGGLFGLLIPERHAVPDDGDRLPAAVSRRTAFGALILFAALLVLLPILSDKTDLATVRIADAAYRSGALVFGGGHVVLPLLQEATVGPGWIGVDAFVAGYGLVQAVPGPLFTFSAYLGTVMSFGPGGVLGGAIMLVAIFLPSFLLVVGVLPFWDGLRRRVLLRRALSGVNAAVVGLLLAALWDPVITSAIHDWIDAALALLALAALMLWRVPPWLVVALGAAAGAVIGAL